MGLLRRLAVPLLGLVAAVAPVLTVKAARIAADESEFGEVDERHRDYKVETDLWCIALAVYHEGGSMQAQGRRGIARLVIERVLADLPQWGGRDICDVVFHKRGRVCQFPFACLPHAWRTPHVGPLWQRAVAIAGEALLTPGEPANAIRYAMNPAITSDRDVCRFRKAFVPVIGVGRHEFFREATEAEREALAASDPVECQRHRAAVAWKKKLAEAAAKKRRKAHAKPKAKQRYAGK